jgi:hypothetical protein
MKWVTNAEANNIIDLGCDHRSVMLMLGLPSLPQVPRKHLSRKKRRMTSSWYPVDEKRYRQMLTASLDDLNTEVSLDSRLQRYG